MKTLSLTPLESVVLADIVRRLSKAMIFDSTLNAYRIADGFFYTLDAEELDALRQLVGKTGGHAL